MTAWRGRRQRKAAWRSRWLRKIRRSCCWGRRGAGHKGRAEVRCVLPSVLERGQETLSRGKRNRLDWGCLCSSIQKALAEELAFPQTSRMQSRVNGVLSPSNTSPSAKQRQHSCLALLGGRNTPFSNVGEQLRNGKVLLMSEQVRFRISASWLHRQLALCIWVSYPSLRLYRFVGIGN